MGKRNKKAQETKEEIEARIDRVIEKIDGTHLDQSYRDSDGKKRVIITEKVLTSYLSIRGGITSDTLIKLGVLPPPPSGWKRKLIGQSLPFETHLELIDEERLDFKSSI
jgi:hypothetical protein